VVAKRPTRCAWTKRTSAAVSVLRSAIVVSSGGVLLPPVPPVPPVPPEQFGVVPTPDMTWAMWPSPKFSAIHRFLSGPTVMAIGRLPGDRVLNSVMEPLVVM
jgi:hypothetical protein